MKLVALLISRNQCLRRLREASRVLCEFLRQPGEDDFMKCFENLEALQEHAYEALKLFDGKIAQEAELIGGSVSLSESEVALIQEQLEIRSVLVREILEQNKEIVLGIESRGETILSTIYQAQKSQNIVKRFKSQLAKPSGEEIDQIL